MPTCSQATIDANEILVGQINPGKNYYEIHVTIISSTSTMITLDARNAKDRNGNTTLQMPLNDPKVMWMVCPSTLLLQPGYPAHGVTGTVYIAIDHLQGFTFTGTPTKWPKVN